MDIFPSVLVGMSVYHLKLSLVNTNSSVDVSRTEIELSQTSRQRSHSPFTVSVETEQLLPQGSRSSPHAMLHLPGAVSLQFVTSVQSSCEARRGAWSILCFKYIWTLHSQLQLGYFMDPAVISVGILRTRPPGLAQLALLCPAV